MTHVLKKRVAIFISGRGSNMDALLAACAQPDFPAETCLVLSNKPDAKGLARAQAAGLPTVVVSHKDYDTRDAFDSALDQALTAHDIDIVCLAGFLRLLTDGFVEKWSGSMLNIHPSLLPSFKGLHTHQRAIDAGVKFTGCTVHFVVPEMDAGPIIIQAAVPILPQDTEATLGQRVLAEEHTIYPQALGWLASGRLSVQNNQVIVQECDGPLQSLRNPATD